MGDDRTLAPYLGDLVKLILVFRLGAVLLTVVWLPVAAPASPALVGAILLAGATSLVPLLCWARLGPALMRHPASLGLELTLAVAILVVAGTSSPFFAFTLATAALAGALYAGAGAALFSGLLLLAYYWALSLHAWPTGRDVFTGLVATPALYPVAAAAGMAVRGLLARQAATDAALGRAAEEAAASDERSRLAREMHDSLAKTVQGIALSAWALSADGSVPTSTGVRAKALAASAQTALDEARALLTDLRYDDLDRCFAEVVRRVVEEWAEEGPVTVQIKASEDLPGLTPDTRYELLAILKEALTNIERHARACSVDVSVTAGDGSVSLRIADDGMGLDGDLDDFAAAGHYGVVGMRERAERVGGRLEAAASPSGGLALTATVPVTDGQQRRSERSLLP